MRPVRKECRDSGADRFGEAYLLQNTSTARYIAGQTAVKCANYMRNIDLLKKLIDSGKINTKDEAREWILKSAEAPEDLE